MNTRGLAAVLLVCVAGPGLAESGNLLGNGGFEVPEASVGGLPEGWLNFTSRRVGIVILAGKGRGDSQCVLLATQRIPKAGQGIVSVVEVRQGEKYDFTAYVKNNADAPLKGTAFGQLVIEWQNKSGLEVGRTLGDAWGSSISRLTWKKVGMKKVMAPAGAAKAKFGVHLYDGEGQADGSFLVDDAEVVCR